jgi:hypothetical protein
METYRVGVFATQDGWRLAGPAGAADYPSHSLAVKAAYRLAHLARWRGAEVQILVQGRPGEALTEAPWGRLPAEDD